MSGLAQKRRDGEEIKGNCHDDQHDGRAKIGKPDCPFRYLFSAHCSVRGLYFSERRTSEASANNASQYWQNSDQPKHGKQKRDHGG